MKIINKETGESLSFDGRVLLQNRSIGQDKFKSIADLDLQVITLQKDAYKHIAELITKTITP